MIRVPKAAQILDAPEWTVYDWVRRGVLPPGVAVRLGRSVRIDEEGLRAWVAAGGAGAETPQREVAAAR